MSLPESSQNCGAPRTAGLAACRVCIIDELVDDRDDDD
jgi:hypothetical protein